MFQPHGGFAHLSEHIARWAGRPRAWRRTQSRLREICVCVAGQGKASAVHAHIVRDGTAFHVHGEGSPVRDGSRRIIAVVPKSFYLTRVLEVPQVRPAEAGKMLQLEMLALLPPELKDAQISHRQLDSRRERYDRYEVYAARREVLRDYMALLSAAGFEPEWLVPSAAVWREVLQHRAVDVLVMPVGAESLEAVSIAGDGSVAIRTLAASALETELAGGLGDLVRMLLSQRGNEGGLKIGWLTAAPPAHLVNERLTFKLAAEVFAELPAAVQSEPLVTALAAAASAILISNGPTWFDEASLLPPETSARRLRREIVRAATTAGVMLALSCALIFAALHVVIHRTQNLSDRLGREIATIRAEGEAITRRADQIESIRRVRTTRGQLANLLSALAAGTPPGVTYNSVELDPDGAVRLQGQAETLDLPFLLPGRLAAQPDMTGVVVKDASRSRRGENSVAEFRAEGKLALRWEE